MLDPSDAGHSEKLRHQTVLAAFGELALRSNDLDEILTEACRLVGDALGTDLAKVVELQADGHTLLVRAGVGWKPGVIGEVKIEIADDTSEAHALKTGEPMISPDIALETRFRYPDFLVENGVQAVANVVILGGDGRRPFGILQIDSRAPRRFNDEDTTFLRVYASLIAAAVNRLRLFAELRDGEERLRLALDAGELGSWAQDLDTGRVVGSRRTALILGLAEPSTAWTFESFLTQVLPDDRAHVIRSLEGTAETGAEWRFECRVHRASDGEVRWVELRGKRVGDQDATRRTELLAILSDITDRKAIEETLAQSNTILEATVAERTRELVAANERLRTEAEERGRMEDALRQASKMEAIGQLTGGLAHDFNNFLGAISGSLELMRQRALQGRTLEFGRYIDLAMAETARAAALTHRLLAFSRRQTLDPRSTDVNRLIEGMAALFRNTVGPAIDLQTRLAPELWRIFCDSNQLENALLNIVINARDAMADGGTLTVETSNHVVTAENSGSDRHTALSNGEYVAVRLTDTGAGMTPDVMARAFDPFFTTKPLGQGTGLGMSMVNGFVQQSGGQILLRSSPAEGTAVTIYLPRHAGECHAEQAHTETPTSLLSSSGRAVVLVVEDEPAMRMIVVETLSDLGYSVLEAGDGWSGLRIAETAGQIDMLVSDVGLPGGMNGRQLADAARQRRPDLKVLFITGYAEGFVSGDDLRAQGMQVLTKPFAIDALAVRVREMISDPPADHG